MSFVLHVLEIELNRRGKINIALRLTGLLFPQERTEDKKKVFQLAAGNLLLLLHLQVICTCINSHNH